MRAQGLGQVWGTSKAESVACVGQPAPQREASGPGGLRLNTRKLNQTSGPQEAGPREVSFHGATLCAHPFAHRPSGRLGLGTDLEHLSSD